MRLHYLLLLAACAVFLPRLSAQTLTLTASTVVMHEGDPVPPLTFSAAGYIGGDTWGKIVRSGLPSISTTATSSSPAGSYPVTITAGTMTPAGSYKFAFVNAKVIVIASDPYGAKIQNTVHYGPRFAINVLTQTLVPRVYGDCVHDDTAAITALFTTGRTSATAFYGSRAKTLYFPAGCYLLSDRLLWNGCSVSIFGDGPGKTVFKVAASTPRYANASAPYDVIHYASTNLNQAFFNYAENFSIDVGPGNPGARALNFTGSNFNKVANVVLYSEDGQGVCGLCMPNQFPGPTMVKNVAVYGFGQGMFLSQNEYNVVAEGVTVENQSKAGVASPDLSLSFRKLLSYNAVTAFQVGNASNVLVNAELLSSGGTSAITAGAAGQKGTLYLGDIHVGSGYKNSLVDIGQSPAVTLTQAGNPVIAEHWTGSAQTLFGDATPRALHLPVEETPEPADDPNPAHWTALSPNAADWPAQIAHSASATVYVPVLHNYGPGNIIDNSNDVNFTGVYKLAAPAPINITVPDNVNHIAMNMMHIGTSDSMITFTVAGSAKTPLVIDHFNTALTINHIGSRAVVVKDGSFTYQCSAGAGNVFWEDVGPGLTTFCAGQKIWARQLNDEASGPTVKPSNVTLASQLLTMNTEPNTIPVGANILIVNLGTNNTLNGKSAVVRSNTGTVMTATLSQPHPDIPSTPETKGFFTRMVPKLQCTGCTIWILGYKTEVSTNALELTDARGEVLGGFHYPNRAHTPDNPLFILNDSDFFASGTSFAAPQYPSWVRETRGGVTRSLANHNPNTGYLNMFYSEGKRLGKTTNK